jgi:hypothetical protein
MTIKIFVFNCLTKEVFLDTTVTVDSTVETAMANHKVFREIHPDCQVNFVIDQNNFIFAAPLNMEKDEQAYNEGRMTWNEYVTKWHGGSALESDSDMPDDEIERQIDELIEADWNEKDSICQ